jgi:hypothetical protein
MIVLSEGDFKLNSCFNEVDLSLSSEDIFDLCKICLDFKIFFTIAVGLVEKLQICSSKSNLSFIEYVLSSIFFSNVKSLSSFSIQAFSSRLFNISLHLSICNSLSSFLKKLLIQFLALVVFTKDI